MASDYWQGYVETALELSGRSSRSISSREFRSSVGMARPSSRSIPLNSEESKAIEESFEAAVKDVDGLPPRTPKRCVSAPKISCSASPEGIASVLKLKPRRSPMRIWFTNTSFDSSAVPLVSERALPEPPVVVSPPQPRRTLASAGTPTNMSSSAFDGISDGDQDFAWPCDERVHHEGTDRYDEDLVLFDDSPGGSPPPPTVSRSINNVSAFAVEGDASFSLKLLKTKIRANSKRPVACKRLS